MTIVWILSYIAVFLIGILCAVVTAGIIIKLDLAKRRREHAFRAMRRSATADSEENLLDNVPNLI